jgi:hypothetical protein
MVFPVATITYANDVAPHLQRSLMYRRLRLQRWQDLHSEYNRYDGIDPSLSHKTAQFFNLLIEVVVIAFFVAGSRLVDQRKLSRLHDNAKP